MIKSAAKPTPTVLRRSTTTGRIRQLVSHAHLLTDMSTAPAVSTSGVRRDRPDAIVIPTVRPASMLTGLIGLSARMQTRVVVLCSGQANFEQVAERIAEVPRARGVVVQVDEEYRHPAFPEATSDPAFRQASAYRQSDLSTKRNFGLLMARLAGWGKIVFLDDDITVTRPAIARLTEHLDNQPIAGMVCRDFPDNSVVCHARRLAKLPQDNFVTGAVMGVNCHDHPLPFFPNIYNEDWFSFGEAVARHGLVKVGEARQAPYDPFHDPDRARREEFGDLLAEGLYALFQRNGPNNSLREHLHHADERYWSTFIAARHAVVTETRQKLEAFRDRLDCSDDVYAAIKSLEASTEQYEEIDAGLCVSFMDAWQGDLSAWQRTCTKVNQIGTLTDALNWLGAPGQIVQ